MSEIDYTSHSCAPSCAEHPFGSGHDWSGGIRAVVGPGPFYKPDGPPPEGTVRVALAGESYGEPATFSEYDASYALHRMTRPDAVFEVPREQFERWQAALAAFYSMQDEIEALIDARR